MKILVMNAGSSSQKSCLYQIESEVLPEKSLLPIWEAKIDWTRLQNVAEIDIKTSTGKRLQEKIEVESQAAVMAYMLNTLCHGSTQVISQLSEIDIVGHRVVHGGQYYQESTIITDDVKEMIARLFTLAPIHNPANLQGIEIIEKSLGKITQVAVFDTAFHTQIPDAAAIYPVPYELVEQGIRRYGFHGTSHKYCATRAAQILNRDLESLRLITCHLGNGCSLAAIKNGYSIDTTMGFTPLDGLMMGSRSGSIDPGIIIHLLRQHNYSASKLEYILNQVSGLKGISGISHDLREVTEEMVKGNSRAQLAWDMYIHRLQSGIGAMLASLQGLDVLVFTAGVGENSFAVRQAACAAFGFLGLKLDDQKNMNLPVDEDIATSNSSVRILVIHTQEDWAIACECWRLYNLSSGT